MALGRPAVFQGPNVPGTGPRQRTGQQAALAIDHSVTGDNVTGGPARNIPDKFILKYRASNLY